MVTDFGKILRGLRIDYDLTMRKLADKLGVNPAYISGLEGGKYAVTQRFLDTLFDTFPMTPEARRTVYVAALGNKMNAETKLYLDQLAHADLNSNDLKRIKHQLTKTVDRLIRYKLQEEKILDCF